MLGVRIRSFGSIIFLGVSKFLFSNNRIPRMQGQQEILLSCDVELTVLTNKVIWSRPPITMDFQVKYIQFRVCILKNKGVNVHIIRPPRKVPKNLRKNQLHQRKMGPIHDESGELPNQNIKEKTVYYTLYFFCQNSILIIPTILSSPLKKHLNSSLEIRPSPSVSASLIAVSTRE